VQGTGNFLELPGLFTTSKCDRGEEGAGDVGVIETAGGDETPLPEEVAFSPRAAGCVGL
jgi:hypothetical protein